MARKKWTPNTEISPSLLLFREKRKWQIALRRYVIQKSPTAFYAPYFGLDIKNIRDWFQFQFKDGLKWENFGEKWQFDHIIPVTYFDFNNDSDLKLCWNFTNLTVEILQKNKNRGNRIDVLGAKKYFKGLYEATGYKPCLNLLNKIDNLELSEFISTHPQQTFLKSKKEYLEHIENYSNFEFELLNSGRSLDEVQREIDLFKRPEI